MNRKVVPLFVTFALIGTVDCSVAKASPSPIDVRATLSVSQQLPAPSGVGRATGIFTAKLSQRKLSWRLAYNGLSSPVVEASLHRGARGRTGPVAIRLCGPCASGAPGTALLDAATATAVGQQRGYIELSTVKNPHGEIRGQISRGTISTGPSTTSAPTVTSTLIAPSTAVTASINTNSSLATNAPTTTINAAAVTINTSPPTVTSNVVAPSTAPTLEIMSPRPGEIITPPTAVRFKVDGFVVGPGAGRIVAYIRGSVDYVRVELVLGAEPGLASLPANKLLSGRRDMAFALARADGTLLENSEAQFTVQGLTILGGR